MSNIAKKIEQLESRIETLETENKKLKRRLYHKTDKDQLKENQRNKISRRSFIRKLGAGAIGLGALSLSPVTSSLKISKNSLIGSGINFGDSGAEYFKVNSGGPVEVKNTNLRLDTGSAIEDGSGTERIELDSGYTRINDVSGNRIMRSWSDYTSVYSQNGKPWRIFDDEGVFPAVQYLTSASEPGTLQLINSNLEINTGQHLKEQGSQSGMLMNKVECPTSNPNNQIVKAEPKPKGIIFVTVHETSDSAVFILEGPGLGTYELQDPRNAFGSTKNSGNDYNVYYDSNKDQYDIQNDTSSDRGFHVWHFGRI